MGSMFRSEEMTLCQLFLQSEAAYACVSELGELAMVQFRDLNPGVNAFQRKFVNEVRRCDEMERKLRYIEREMKKEEMTIPEYGEPPRAPVPKEMIDLEATFEKMESELREVNTNSEALKRNFQELTELKEVLKKTQIFFTEYGAEHHSIVVDAQQALVVDEFSPMPSTIQLGFVAGVIPRERMASFERILWFACRGNVFLRTEDIVQPMEDPGSGDEINKCVFIIFYQGDQLKTRVRKICDGYRATLYPCPESAHERNEMLSGVSMRLEDLNHVLEQTKEHRIRMLKNANKEICNWILKVRKIKAIYHTLNMCNFDLSHNSLIAEGWCPVKYLDDIHRALQHATDISGSNIPCILNRMPTTEEPPTFFHTNKFTAGFQAIVDAYGVANYREVNPALYTCATFPFLFGVMFGDAGHGSIMFLFGLYMILFEKKIASEKSDNEIWNTFFGGRYIIMMMGLFSIYTGLIYNDVFSKSLNIFGSAWYPNYPEGYLDGKLTLQLNPNGTFRTGDPYQFGLDPVWQFSKNKITFTNSYKMKLAVILGVTHMLFGVSLSLANHLHFRRWVDIFCEFIPQVLFLLSIFGYLVALIFYKWLAFDFSTAGDAPSLLIHLINMFMFKYPTSPASQATFYPYQMYVQYGMFGLAIICVPWMLLIKPFIIRAKHNRKSLGHHRHDVSTDQLIDNEIMPDHDPPPGAPNGEKRVSKGASIELGTVMPGTASVNSGLPGEVVTHSDIELGLEKGSGAVVEEEEEDEFDFSEVFIHQAIHTIEYCLGCISNTASYLRLWALSLAHAQLSEVLWSMVLHLSLSIFDNYLGSIAIFLIFTFWAILTIAVLLIMEGLSAFLHALRLHWVEFQNKFYVGQGYVFMPFSFKSALDLSEDFK